MDLRGTASSARPATEISSGGEDHQKILGVDLVARFHQHFGDGAVAQGAFHEACTVGTARRLVDALQPVWLRIAGYWYPRGGIPIDVFYQTDPPPAGLWGPDPGVSPYPGRG